MIHNENSISILDSVFKIRRIVNAREKTILNFDTDSNIEGDEHLCFEFWEKGRECTNCISMRALIENKSYSKFETVNNTLYMIIASPIKVRDDIYVLELVKDVSEDTISTYFNSIINKELEAEILRLNNLVVTDELTSVYNRRFMNEKLPSAVSRLSNSLFSLSVILIDIDKFKYINDSFGHVMGDYILKDISIILNTFANKYGGWLARYGGDEFIMVFEDILSDNLENVINELEILTSNNTFIYDDVEIKTSCSFGYTVINDCNTNVDNLIKEIDDKLFFKKKCI